MVVSYNDHNKKNMSRIILSLSCFVSRWAFTVPVQSFTFFSCHLIIRQNLHHNNDVCFTVRAMLRKARYCCWKSFVSPSVCNIDEFIVGVCVAWMISSTE